MDTRLLRTFLTVARTGSFTAAAAELNFTQSTVTAHVQRLERLLGSPVLDRLPGHVTVTAVGAAVIGPAEELLAAEERVRAAGGERRAAGTVRLMAPETLCTYWLPDVIGALRRIEPEVQIWVTAGGTHDGLDAVGSGSVDLAVTLEPRTPVTDLALTRLGIQPLVFVDRPGPDAGGARAPSSVPGPATWSNLADRDALLLEEGCGYGDLVADRLAATGRRSGRRSRFGSVEAIKRCVGVGLGWTALPRLSVEAEIGSGDLAVLAGPELPDCEVHVASHPRRYRSPAMLLVLSELERSWPRPPDRTPAVGP
ncbi:LysR family transcriptional regulator [Occultella glacieicola]|uniref:LysR family transcriptional regulator n=1 Tax=Occultella glacieicola TaxID=2518684 RepID=A0ABY2DZ34_9MICO|nr:LysR family transcriptional regulator [Occultella glacieicola]TDE89940.1 LysR family transcriptional regulator [Occultella glacieicola]